MIAGELHDGLVQSLAGVAIDLAGSADRTTVPGKGRRRARAEGVRAAMREARSLLVQLYPPEPPVGRSRQRGDLPGREGVGNVL